MRRAVHLAYILNPIHDRGLMRAVNVQGTENFLHACAAAEVEALIVVTSGTAYGAWPDNPTRLTESDPLRGKPGFPYVEDKLEQERLARAYQLAHPGTRVMVVRPSVVIGARINNFISRFYAKPFAITVSGYNPPTPLVHEEDVARALWTLLRQGSTGAYNLDAPDPPLLTEAAQMLGARAVGVPAGLLYPIADLGWHLRIKAITEAPAAMLDYIRYSWLMDGTKVVRETDFDYAKTAREALLGFVATVNGVKKGHGIS